MLRTHLLLETRACTKVHVLVVSDETVENDSRFHDLKAVAHALANNGLRVTFGHASAFTERIGHNDALTMFSTYDAVLLQGPSATMLADFAAYSNTSVVRFVGVREAGVNDDIPPLHERPEVVVLGSDTGAALPKEPGLWYTSHMELPVGSVKNPGAPQYQELVQRILPLCKAGSQMREAREKNENLTKDIMGLVIIAKNEALRISDPLLSMKDHIDYWTVLDANSTDNTSEVVTQLMQGRPGHLLHHNFTDFSTARNTALNSHGQHTKYAVMLDADMSIPAAWRLRVTLQRVAQLCAAWEEDPMCFQAFQVQAFVEGVKFFTDRIFPTADIGTLDGWHYTYPVHEIPQLLKMPSSVSPEETTVKLLTVDIMTAEDPSHRRVARAKELDLRLLREERQKKPDDTRVAFYLAQTLQTVSMLPEAVDAYEERVQMGGWYEEVFESLLRKGRILVDLKKDPMRDLMRAVETSPYRAEPFRVMAWHHAIMSAACNASGWFDSACFLRHRVAALHYAKRASKLPQPRKDLMFVDLSTYTEHALGAVVDHAFQVAWKTQGAAYMGKEAASFLNNYRGRHLYNRTRAQELVDKYKELAAWLRHDRGVMWAKPSV
ncbi:hypothetical protein COCOBI_05-2410 [Coccomyxa sp. Obi]|nr:hypothetical protein COCOBI_05-2410 [Coccomyxa sp. Obi]